METDTYVSTCYEFLLDHPCRWLSVLRLNAFSIHFTQRAMPYSHMNPSPKRLPLMIALAPHEHLVRLILRLLSIAIPQLLEERRKTILLTSRTLNPSKDLANITTIVPVMEQTDVETGLQSREKLVQRTSTLRELKRKQSLILGIAASADQVSDVALGDFVATDIARRHAFLLQTPEEILNVPSSGCCRNLHTNQHGCAGGIVVAVAELRDCHWVHGRYEFGKGAGFLGDSNREESLLLLTNSGTFSDESQSVEVHVCSTSDGYQLTAGVLGWVGSNILLESSERESSCWFENRARVLEDVLDGCADIVGVDLDDFVHNVLADAECLLTHSLHSSSICEEAHLSESHSLSKLERLNERVRIVRLHSDDLDVRCESLDVDSDTSDETTTSNTAEDGLQLAQICLSKNLCSDRSLSCNDIWVIEGRDVDQTIRLCSPITLSLGFVKVLSVKYNIAPKSRDILVLDGWSSHRHGDGCGDTKLSRRVSNTLSVVTSRASDDSLPSLFLTEVGHFVVSTSQLEGEDGKQVLPLEEDLRLKTIADVDGMCEGSLFDHIVDFGCGDQANVLLEMLVIVWKQVFGKTSLTSGKPFGRQRCSGTSDL